MKHTLFVLVLAALGGCASTGPAAPAMPSAHAPRIPINRPPPRKPVDPIAASAAQLPGVAVAATVPPAPSWLVQQSDGTVATMLARWGKAAGWAVRWEGLPEIPITGNSAVDKPDFIGAADFVVSDLQAKGHAIKAKAFADNVLVIQKKVDQ